MSNTKQTFSIEELFSGKNGHFDGNDAVVASLEPGLVRVDVSVSWVVVFRDA